MLLEDDLNGRSDEGVLLFSGHDLICFSQQLSEAASTMKTNRENRLTETSYVRSAEVVGGDPQYR